MKKEDSLIAQLAPWLIPGFVLLMVIWSSLEQFEANREKQKVVDQLLGQVEAGLKQSEAVSRFGGSKTEHTGGETFTEQEMNEEWDGSGHTRSYSNKNKEVVFIGTKGTDYRLHFYSSFLSGYAPFQAEDMWVPHFIIKRRKTYQLDEFQYPGHPEVWQSSYEAHQSLKGDCEDHAIALADWLIEMGHDARVVVGTCNGGGHAWVVLFKEDKVYLLEATSKKSRFRNAIYPDVLLSTEYEPEYMFNREKFWVNTGSLETTDYTGSRWSHRSTYSAP